MKKVFCISALAMYVLLSGISSVYAQQFEITSPQKNATVSEEVITVEGNGATAANATIEISVFTDKWYPQSGTATIAADGKWTYTPCYLSGQGRFNNHRIRARLLDSNNKELANKTVDHITRNP